jgi:protein-tyrosine-phosphatase
MCLCPDGRTRGWQKPAPAAGKELFIKQEILNVLFLCTGNSARSIMAEAILNFLGKPKFKGFSAGSHPLGRVNPLALELLEKNRFAIQGLRSKDWSEFAQPGAPFMHFVFTLCDQAAAEPCPVWPGQPMTAHWGLADPAAVQGGDEDKRRAFFKAYTELQRRISLFVNLPFDKLGKLSLQEKLNEIGRTQ